jgi:hypothetical protein
MAEGALYVTIQLVPEMSLPCTASIHVITITDNESLYVS